MTTFGFDFAHANASRKICGLTEATRLAQRDACKSSLLYLAKNILGYRDLDPTIHGPIAAAWQSNDPDVMVEIPRGHLKSTLCTISYAIWLIAITEGRCRILIVNATLRNAKGFLRAIKDHLEGRGSDSRFAQLFPEFKPYAADGSPIADKWTEEELTVKRDITATEPTVSAAGVGGNLVAAHYTHILYDDLVNAENTMTSGQIRKTLKWYRESQSLFVPGNEPWERKKRVCGTRWHWDDLYGWIERNESYNLIKHRCVVCPTCGPNAEVNLDFVCQKCKSLATPLLPNLFSHDKLQGIRRTQGSTIFSSQYLMDPTPSDEAAFRRDNLNYYIDLPRSRREIPPGWPSNSVTRSDLNIFTTIDTSIGESERSDFTAFVTCGWSRDGRIFVLEVVRERLRPDEIIALIFDTYARWRPVKMGVEGEKYAKALKHFFDKEAMRRSVYPYFEELPINTRISKELRIRALQPWIENGALWLRSPKGNYDSLKDGMYHLVDELLRFPRSPHDDCIDALAMQLQIGIKPDEDAGASPRSRPNFDFDGHERSDRRRGSCFDNEVASLEYEEDLVI